MEKEISDDVTSEVIMSESLSISREKRGVVALFLKITSDPKNNTIHRHAVLRNRIDPLNGLVMGR